MSFARRETGGHAEAVKAFASAAGSPVIEGDALVEWVRADFGVSLTSTSQVFGGQDSEAVVMHAATVDGAAVAVKVSRSVGIGGLLVSAHLAGQIPSGVPTPLQARSGQPYSIVSGRRLSLTPWISGRRAFGTGMEPHQWRSFGALLSRVHAAQVPLRVANRLPVEDYRTPAAAIVRTLDTNIRGQEARRFARADETPLTGALIRDWLGAADSLAVILEHVDDLGEELRAGSAATVVCHSDAHIANVLLDDHDEVWLLDWDEVVRAPRERDLMFVIGGVLADAPVTGEEQRWFFDGYGPAEIDPIRVAYYRCSWALQDVADYAARVLERSGGPSAAGQALTLFRDVVSPTGIVALAHQSLQQIGRGVSA